MNENRGILVPLVAAIFLLFGIREVPQSPGTHSQLDPVFKVVVVGAGLNGGGFSGTCLPHPDDACAMARGVHAAFESKEMAPFAKRIAYSEKDDTDDPVKAQKVAEDLAADPSVLVVIGHSSSSTTRSSAPIYHHAQIPIVVPIASTPYLKYPAMNIETTTMPLDLAPDPDDQLNNVFSIIPNDKIGQAPAIAYLVTHMRMAEHTNIVAYNAENTDYVIGLKHELHRLLPDVHIVDWNGTCKDRSIDTRLQASSLAATVVLIAPAECANKFLPHLNEVSPQTHTVILTDGAKSVDRTAIQDCHCDVLITFPTKPLTLNDPATQGSQSPSAHLLLLLNKTIIPNAPQSYEEYGFDSVLLIAKALTNLCGDPQANGTCKQPIERASLLNAMQRITYLSGARMKYLFISGENVHPEYNVYGYTSRNANVPVKACSALVENNWTVASAPAEPATSATLTPPLPRLQFMCSIEFEDIHSND